MKFRFQNDRGPIARSVGPSSFAKQRFSTLFVSATLLTLLVPLASCAQADQPAKSGDVPPPVAAEFKAYRKIVSNKPQAAAQAALLRHLLDPRQEALKEVLLTAKQGNAAEAMNKLRSVHRQLPQSRFVQIFPTERLSWPRADLQELASTTKKRGYESNHHPLFAVTPPLSWEANPFHDRGWCFKINSWQFLDPFLILYDRDKKQELLKYPLSVVLDWMDAHIARQRQHEFAWYDMAVGRRAAMLGYLIDSALHEPDFSISDENLTRLLVAARFHLKYLSDESQIAWHSNHGLAQLAGLLALSRSVPELEGADQAREFAESNLRRLFREQFTEQGIHREHSPMYHVELVNFLWHLLETGYVTDPELKELCQLAAENTGCYVHPNGTISRVGDGDTQLAIERMHYPASPQLKYLLSEGKRGEAPTANFRVFPQSGYACFRGPWRTDAWRDSSYLFFSAGFHSRMHKQADDFTFEWSDHGEELLIDAGKFNYNKNAPQRKYVESTRAHNTVEIDEKDYSRYRLDAFGSAITKYGEADGTYYVEAEVNRKRFFKTQHRRLLVFQPGRWLVVIDRLSSDKPHTYTQWFHFGPQLNVRQQERDFVAQREDGGAILQVTPLYRQTDLEFTLANGQTKPRLQGWTSLNYGELTPNPAAGFTLKDKKGAFVTLFWLREDSPPPRPGATLFHSAGRKIQVRWNVNGQEHGFDYVSSDAGGKLQLIRQAELAKDRRRETTH